MISNVIEKEWNEYDKEGHEIVIKRLIYYFKEPVNEFQKN